MRRLTLEEMDIPSGGSTPGLACNTTDSNSSVSGNTATSHSTVICQTSSGLTIITTTDTLKVFGEVGITGKIKEIVGFTGKVGYESTTTDTTTCKPNGDCTTVHKESTIGSKSSDAADAAFESLADFGSNGWGDNADWGDGGAWAGGEGGGMGGGGGSLFDDEYEIAMC